MNLDKLYDLTSNLTYFDLAYLIQMTGEKRHNLLIQLGRWRKKDKIISLKRGLYTLGENHRRLFNPAEFAYAIYNPSYLSLEWALSFYGLIPEKTTTWTSVTTRVTRKFKNDFGIYSYQKIHNKHFWGFSEKIMQDRPVFLATPEKAILDYFYLTSGDWTDERLFETRWQNLEILNLKIWKNSVKRFSSPRLTQISKRFLKCQKTFSEEYQTL